MCATAHPRANRHVGTATTLSPEMTPEEHELLLGVLRDEQPAGKHLEVGTAAGGTLCAMLEALPMELRHFVVVDRMQYFEGQLDAVNRNLKRHDLDPDVVDFRIMPSSDAFRAAEQEGEVFDFILIDAGHKLLDVMGDLRWTRLLSVNGVVCLHDYDRSLSHRGVVVAVDRFLAVNPQYERIGYAGRLLALRKTRPVDRPEVTGADWCYALVVWLPLRVVRTIAKLWHRVGRRLRRFGVARHAR